MSSRTHDWSRRQWLARHTLGVAALTLRQTRQPLGRRTAHPLSRAAREAKDARLAQQAVPLDPVPWQGLALRAVDVARTAGAQYADARVTRRLVHAHDWAWPLPFSEDEERVGIGVRALVEGYWGFSASTDLTPDTVVELAQDAVRQARASAPGHARTVDMGQYTVATGTWSTPVRIDPFTVSIEEKKDEIMSWKIAWYEDGYDPGERMIHEQAGWGFILFVRQERVVATSDGALFTQTCFETGAQVLDQSRYGGGDLTRMSAEGGTNVLRGLDWAGAGWEHFLDAKVAEQILSGQFREAKAAIAAIPKKPSTIGRYTLVCDGATMAAMLELTLGAATQLDRALGYEANAGGTSWLPDPLGMVGHATVASPLVTLTANRSAPQQLATVKWDEEGVEPEPFTLVKDGVLVDFQTTREQAAWLAPYYQQHGRPVRSHGCAAVESAHGMPLQQMPNLSLEPSPSSTTLEDLVKAVPEGILVTKGEIVQLDSQGRTGILIGGMREIRNGRLGPGLVGGAVLFDAAQWWRALTALGGPATQGGITQSSIPVPGEDDQSMLNYKMKGEPRQLAPHTIRAVAATITNQPVIDFRRSNG